MTDQCVTSRIVWSNVVTTATHNFAGHSLEVPSKRQRVGEEESSFPQLRRHNTFYRYSSAHALLLKRVSSSQRAGMIWARNSPPHSHPFLAWHLCWYCLEGMRGDVFAPYTEVEPVWPAFLTLRTENGKWSTFKTLAPTLCQIDDTRKIVYCGQSKGALSTNRVAPSLHANAMRKTLLNNLKP